MNDFSNVFREKLQKEVFVSGTHININDPCVSKIVGMLGFDYVWIDTEHSYLSYENLLSHIQTIQAYGTPVIVRVPQHDFTATKKILEMGPDGIVFPMVRSAKEANELIEYTLYPPQGCRGFGPGNAITFGLENAAEYIKHNDRLTRFIQIEHISLIEELEEVVKNPYIDGYIFGPNDLSGSIDELLNVFGKNNISLMEKAIGILKKHNKVIGLSTYDSSAEIIDRWRKLGIKMISAGSDFSLLANGMNDIKKQLDIVKVLADSE